jgi:NTF2-related export protein 1/2
LKQARERRQPSIQPLSCRNKTTDWQEHRTRSSDNMATLTETDYTRVSNDAAEHFTDAFYTALNGSRNQLASFYVPAIIQPSGRGLPHISYNGEVTNDAAAFADKFEKEMPWTHYEPQSLDVHVLNRALLPVEGKSKKELERNMSLTVQVSGYVRLYERKDGPMKGFSDSFVLVPNKEEVGGKGTAKSGHGRQWVIQTQNFRFVT